MPNRSSAAALGTLMILQVTMLMSLYFKIPPHPPEVIPLGGLAPMVGASLCAAWAAWVCKVEGLTGRLLTLLACAPAGISYGPQKFFDPAFPLVWPAVITAQIAILVLLVQVVRGFLNTTDSASPSDAQGLYPAS